MVRLVRGRMWESEGLESWNEALICRQTSGDGSFGELSNLWLQEDNLVIVM